LSSPGREYEDFRDWLLRKGSANDWEWAELLRLRDAALESRCHKRARPGEILVLRPAPESVGWLERRLRSVEAAGVAAAGAARHAEPPAGEVDHPSRSGEMPLPITLAQARLLEQLLKQREADRHDPKFSQPKIARQVGITVKRLRPFEELVAMRFPLTCSDPAFRASGLVSQSDGLIYRPSPRRGRELLDSGEVSSRP
jgi:hypothetical protein